ncbi:CHAT domain-containing protein [Streptomyces sp. Tue 6430]|nr:CHAT domain-containing protein [Streptomyces sp. Tue 6430]
MWSLLVGPFWESADRGGPLTHLTLIPTDDIFAIPLHVATEPDDDRPLAARVPLSHSVSVAAFVTRGRHLLKKQLMEDDDDLAALLSTDRRATGREIVKAGWRAAHVHVAGRVPAALAGRIAGEFGADWEGLEQLVSVKPEFFVYAGHGVYVDEPEASGPLIHLGKTDMLSQFDLALRVSLPRNKLTVLGACLAGQGMGSEGGDVLGFMRSLIISGAGAIGVPLWSVQDSAMVSTVGALLRGSREALGPSSTGVFDVVQALHDHYRRAWRRPCRWRHGSTVFLSLCTYDRFASGAAPAVRTRRAETGETMGAHERTVRRRTALADYEALRERRPELFLNPPGAAFTILLDPAEQERASDEASRAAVAAGLPESAGDIGVVYRDAYFCLVRDAVRFVDDRLGTYIRIVPAAASGEPRCSPSSPTDASSCCATSATRTAPGTGRSPRIR